jgi:hypothetical protein
MTAEQLSAHPTAVELGTGRRRSPWADRTTLAFGIALIAALAIALLQSPKIFYFDSGNYWALGSTFVRHGDFSLMNFNSPLRGYLLPLIDHGLQGIATAFGWTSSTVAKCFNAIVFALIGAVLAPRFAEISWPGRTWNVCRRLLLMALLFVFWSGYLNFPLSDFPALAMVLVALIAAARPDRPGWMLLAGLATGAAIEMRPSYVPLAPIILLLVAWGWVERRKEGPALIPRALCVGLLLAGFVAISLPQSLLTHRYFNKWSFVPGAAINLQDQKLTEGLEFQRVIGYVGPGHPPLMDFEDKAGQELLFQQKNHAITGLSQYLGLVVTHPITMGSVFGRHVIDGMDQRYSTPYVERLDTGSHRWQRLAGFLLVFLALLRVLWPAARRRLGPARWRYPVALLLCCLPSIPSDMEPRYMLPAYLLAYVLVLAPGWPSPIDSEAVGMRRFRTLATIAGAYILFMAVVWHVVSGANHLVIN